MKNFTKTLVAATLTLGAVSVNASILQDNSLNAEAWLSVYDSTSKQTFTLDLGGSSINGTQGITVESLIANKDATGNLVNVDLGQYAHWNAFLSHEDFNPATTKYVVGTAGINPMTYSPNVLITGADNTFFGDNADFTTLGSISASINGHALNISADTGVYNHALNDTTLAFDGDPIFLGQHNEGAGSTQLWGGATYNPNAVYGEDIAFQLSNVDPVTFAAQQQAFAATWKLEGNTLSLTAVPVPAAVWMFGSAMLGLMGVSRKRKTV